ncbi:MAG TPA: redoxin domain-containing protein [Myxococcales bacterium]|nr:redoxin domain-containing protein [Myxococcales bacterium]HET9753710.1 redoxin domain-containing protein [Myxococcales bacterium]
MDAATTGPSARPARVNLKVLVVGALVAAPLLAILVLNLGRDPHSIRSPLVGTMAPPFALSPIGAGEPVRLDALRGRAVVLNFWATWCVPCLQEHEALAAGARAFPDVQFAGVVYEDDPGRTREFLAQRGASPYPALADPGGKTAIAYGVFGVPETFFIDRTGRIVEKYVGPLDANTLTALVRKAMAGGQ